MKRILYLMLSALLLFSCATTKSTSRTPSPHGNWDYTITGTPEGNFSGVLIITQINDTYTAKITSSAGDLPIEKYMYDKSTMKMSGEFDYSGTLVLFDAVMVGDEINGSMSAGGMGFPFKGTRKK
ncbi:MAG: hypothetical protein JNM78_01480 [Cyclobacteriaceae bacterium]|nr:hypothetical protein [Cyclobacteriaceae bacterium]